MPDFEPRIVGFLCKWCSYAGADLAGTSRLKYPDNVQVIKVMCSGRVNPLFILKSFQSGADGVLICGCHPGDCHYTQGNMFTRRRISAFKYLLKSIGIDTRRIRLEWVSAAEGMKFSQLIKEFTSEIKALGPNQQPGFSNPA